MSIYSCCSGQRNKVALMRRDYCAGRDAAPTLNPESEILDLQGRGGAHSACGDANARGSQQASWAGSWPGQCRRSARRNAVPCTARPRVLLLTAAADCEPPANARFAAAGASVRPFGAGPSVRPFAASDGPCPAAARYNKVTGVEPILPGCLA